MRFQFDSIKFVLNLFLPAVVVEREAGEPGVPIHQPAWIHTTLTSLQDNFLGNNKILGLLMLLLRNIWKFKLTIQGNLEPKT